jgi:hypothetical protein
VLAGCGDGEIWLEGKGKEDDEEGRRGGAAISRRCRRKTCERIRLQSSLRKGMINERVLHKYLCPSKLNVVI